MALTSEGLLDIPGAQSRYVRLASGARAHYLSFGRDGIPVLGLHGGIIGSSAAAGFRNTGPYLAERGFQLICPDMPGYGLSDLRPEHWPTNGFYDHTEFLHEFVNAMCLDSFHITGNSMGCINSINYLIAHPDRVRSFAVIAGGFGDAAPIQRLTFHPADAWDGSRDGMFKLMQLIINNDENITDDVLDMRMAHAERNRESFRAFWDAQEAVNVAKDINLRTVNTTRGRLTEMTIPGICIYPVEDRIIPVETGRDQEDALPGVQFFYVTGAGHQAQTDRPDVVNPVLEEFFRDGKVSAKTAEAAGVSDRRPPLPHIVEGS
ncbi:alpha/beta fold hydrolase [Sporichthya polymorpha]|uniref:alpha/beta fold hydrolase n=1 Tax=Sporichthya polymorpha TaxID=35751 RepID=UPI000365B962|nr:alpha/beta hydrolase [Sporichthya polymorpha]